VGAWDLGKEMLENGENHDSPSVGGEIIQEYNCIFVLVIGFHREGFEIRVNKFKGFTCASLG